MTFNQLKNQVNKLMRKYATEIAVYRARPWHWNSATK